MEKLIAACGLDCSKCEAYIATMNNDTEARAEVARKWSEMFGANCEPEDCICEGCMQDGLLSTAHATSCEIRLCASEQEVPTCAHCEDYICERLQHFLDFVPDVKETLDKIRAEEV